MRVSLTSAIIAYARDVNDEAAVTLNNGRLMERRINKTFVGKRHRKVGRVKSLAPSVPSGDMKRHRASRRFIFTIDFLIERASLALCTSFAVPSGDLCPRTRTHPRQRPSAKRKADNRGRAANEIFSDFTCGISWQKKRSKIIGTPSPSLFLSPLLSSFSSSVKLAYNHKANNGVTRRRRKCGKIDARL